jgi:hypothetical protein
LSFHGSVRAGLSGRNGSTSTPACRIARDEWRSSALAERIDHLADVLGLAQLAEPLIHDALAGRGAGSESGRRCARSADQQRQQVKERPALSVHVRKTCTRLPGFGATRMPANHRRLRGEPDE